MIDDLTKILLVDQNYEQISKLLEQNNYKVTCVSNEDDAFEIFEKCIDFDMIILDVTISRMRGWNILGLLRKNFFYKNIPIIILTEISNEDKIVLGLKLGADDYITKPVYSPILLAKIEALLRRNNKFNKNEDFNNVTINQINKFNSLTRREKDVLLLVTKGESNKSIAKKLVLSEITIKSHLNSIFKKLNITNRTQAVLIALQMNMIEE